MERQRALLGQMHTVCSEWRGPGNPEIRAQQALPGAKQCSGPQAEEGTKWPTAPGVLSSCLDSAVLSLTACYDFTQEGFGSTQAGVCLKEPVDIRRVEVSALHRRQQRPEF